MPAEKLRALCEAALKRYDTELEVKRLEREAKLAAIAAKGWLYTFFFYNDARDSWEWAMGGPYLDRRTVHRLLNAAKYGDPVYVTAEDLWEVT